MANRPRIRKRVYAIRRAPDGSAFENCNNCGVSVAVALADMHECEPMKDVKRFRGVNSKQQSIPKQNFGDQPISPFRLFMESFMKSCKNRNLIAIDRRGFEIWKNMSKEERQLYVSQAEKVNSSYLEALLKEVNDMIEVDDEADSAMVGKFDQFYEGYEDHKYYSDSECDWFNNDWDILESWTAEDCH
ncbi:high mobility group B protein 7 [Quillaja saponaria]|uniref:High mobility group B protein 7 n=1 Tax=Quillaja saponaria TaxID=32244 RepID=A0AAD7LVS1_QUISA|nr:high mobility group B protein 7 [Quillaja saponaria]